MRDEHIADRNMQRRRKRRNARAGRVNPYGGFIRAEGISYDELVAIGSIDAAKAAGKLRVEGKDYVVQEGDILHVRFAV